MSPWWQPLPRPERALFEETKIMTICPIHPLTKYKRPCISSLPMGHEICDLPSRVGAQKCKKNGTRRDCRILPWIARTGGHSSQFWDSQFVANSSLNAVKKTWFESVNRRPSSKRYPDPTANFFLDFFFTWCYPRFFVGLDARRL